MEQIRQLHIKERPATDGDRLVELSFALGAADADKLLSGAADDLRLGLELLGRTLFSGDLPSIVQTSTEMRKTADKIGLVTVATVLNDIRISARCGDLPALSATYARLERILDGSLQTMWDIQNEGA